MLVWVCHLHLLSYLILHQHLGIPCNYAKVQHLITAIGLSHMVIFFRLVHRHDMTKHPYSVFWTSHYSVENTTAGRYRYYCYHYLQQRPTHNKHSPPPQSPLQTYKQYAPYTYIYCLYYAKILHIPPPHISSSEEILPRLTRCTHAQLRTDNSPCLNSYLHKFVANYIHHHYAPFVTLTQTTYIISSTAPLARVKGVGRQQQPPHIYMTYRWARW